MEPESLLVSYPSFASFQEAITSAKNLHAVRTGMLHFTEVLTFMSISKKF